MNSTRQKYLFILFLLTSYNFCYSKSLPDWAISGKSDKFPESRFVTGLGIGITKQAADDMAFGEIIKRFVAKVKTVSEDISESNRKYEASGGVKINSEEKIKQITKVTSEKTLTGIEIKETIEKDKKFYSLAVLDKMKMRNDLNEKIMDIDKEIEKMINTAKDVKSDKLKKIRNYYSAISKTIERNIINEDLKIVDPSGTGIPASQSLSDLNNSLTDILTKEFKIGIDLEGNNVISAKEALSEALTNQKFVIEEDKEKCDMVINGNIEIKETKKCPNPDWFCSEYNASFNLIEQKSKNNIGTINIKDKASQLTEEAAKSKALDKLKKDILEKIPAQITKFVFGDK